MCGIGIFFDKNGKELRDLINHSWTFMKHRGEDSYGFIGLKDNGKLKVIKSIKSNRIINSIYKKDTYIWAITHNRKASIGNINERLAHPIIDKDGNNYVIHNGTKKSLYQSIQRAQSDTQAISIIYNQLCKPTDIFEYLFDIGVVLIIDNKTKLISMHKDTERDIYFNKDKNIILSEPVMTGNWQKIIASDSVYSYSEFNINHIINLSEINKKILRINKLEYGLCDVCFKQKLCISENGRSICPECKYNNKKVHEWKENRYFYDKYVKYPVYYGREDII